MTRICLVRHGQTDWNFQGIIQGREDIPLNKVGRQQAKESGQFLSQEKWDYIVASPLSRAYETAVIIGEEIGIKEVECDTRFIERDFGNASGKLIIDARHLVTENKVENLESEEEIRERGLAGLQDLVTRYNGKSILVVAHSHTIKGILSGIDEETFHFSVTLDNACANYLVHDGENFRIKHYNVSEHITV